MPHLVHRYRRTDDGDRNRTDEELETFPTANQPKLILVLKKRGIAGRAVRNVLPRIILDQIAPSRYLLHHRVAGASFALRVGEVAKNRVLDRVLEALVSFFRRVFHRLMDIMAANRPCPTGFHSSIFSTACVGGPAVIRERTRLAHLPKRMREGSDRLPICRPISSHVSPSSASLSISLTSPRPSFVSRSARSLKNRSSS